MGDLRPGQTSSRRPGRKAQPKTQKTSQNGGSAATSSSSGAPGAPSSVRAALGKLRDAAAAHDDELPAPPLPHSEHAQAASR